MRGKSSMLSETKVNADMYNKNKNRVALSLVYYAEKGVACPLWDNDAVVNASLMLG